MHGTHCLLRLQCRGRRSSLELLFLQTVLQHSNQRCATELLGRDFSSSSSNQRRAFFLLLLHFHDSSIHVNSGDIKVQKKKEKKEIEGLGKIGKESNSNTKQILWQEKEQNRGIENCSTFIFLPLCFYQHYNIQVNFNSLEQCSNTREFSTRVLLCPARSLAWAIDRAGWV